MKEIFFIILVCKGWDLDKKSELIMQCVIKQISDKNLLRKSENCFFAQAKLQYLNKLFLKTAV